jgi:O-antigen ligase
MCLGYLGYQVWAGGAGHTVHGRLEGLPVPSAQTSNLFASILVLFLPSLGAFFFISKRKTVKILSILCFPFILNIIFLLNSRGSYLGLITAFCSLFLMARKKERKILAIAVIGALFIVPLLAKDSKIYERFGSIFVEEDQRDYSAESRLIFWGAALDMLSDHPFGLGGHAFKKVYGMIYLEKRGIDVFRAVHNSYLDIATQWGIQGLFLHLLLIYLIFKKTLKAAQYQLLKHNAYHESFFIKACLSGMVGFSASSIFSNTLDEEWLYWMLAMMLGYIGLVVKKNGAVLKF